MTKEEEATRIQVKQLLFHTKVHTHGQENAVCRRIEIVRKIGFE